MVVIDPQTGEETEIPLEDMEVIFFDGARPNIAIHEGRIICYLYNAETGVTALKSIAPDGSDIRILAESEPMY